MVKQIEKARSAHGVVGWLGSLSVPGGQLAVVTECKDRNCGCHEAAKELRKEKTKAT